jgi:flavorubredoxin
MKVLIVYDTVSPVKNTEQVAKNIVETLEKVGVEAKALYVKSADAATVKKYDCLVVGSPTHYRKATKTIMQFLDGLEREQHSGKFAAAFDTRIEHRLAGSAADRIQKKLKKLGFKILSDPLAVYVEREDRHEKGKVYLKAGELDKVKEFAAELAKLLQ